MDEVPDDFEDFLIPALILRLDSVTVRKVMVCSHDRRVIQLDRSDFINLRRLSSTACRYCKDSFIIHVDLMTEAVHILLCVVIVDCHGQLLLLVFEPD